jgi:hypothetical protein
MGTHVMLWNALRCGEADISSHTESNDHESIHDQVVISRLLHPLVLDPWLFISVPVSRCPRPAILSSNLLASEPVAAELVLLLLLLPRVSVPWCCACALGAVSRVRCYRRGL